MKLTNVTTMLKANAVKVLAVTALAGAFFAAAAPAAQAQHVAFGVQIGSPAYYGPRYVAPPVVVYDHRDYYEPYGYDHRGWDARYHHDFDRRDYDRHDFDRREYDHRFDHRGWR
jgi:hypothetical protein